MIALIDTSSLLAFVRYYLPFDNNGTLRNVFEGKYESGEMIVLDKVVEECTYVSQGIVIKKLDFLVDPARKAKIIDTSSLLPSRKFFNMLENQFCNKDVIRLSRITEIEFESAKNSYLAEADSKLILYALNNKARNPVIVTEETTAPNDNKIFRKIPDNCNAIGIEYCSLPVLLSEHYKIDLGDLYRAI